MSKNIKPQTIEGEVVQTASNIERQGDILPDKLVQKMASEICSLTTKLEEDSRRVPRKPRRYPMSATAREMRRLQLKDIIEKIEKVSWLTTDSGSFYLGISPAALRQMVRRKLVVAYKPFGGRKLYFKKSDLDEAVETSKKVGGRKWQ